VSNIRHFEKDIYAEATRIHFREIAKIKCPNQIYFACPKDLIKVGEIPDYAGLLYYDRGITLVKKAPYLHKVKQDMSAVLLSKFYNLWSYKLTIDSQVEISHKAKARLILPPIAPQSSWRHALYLICSLLKID
jgi:hypothetical protein